VAGAWGGQSAPRPAPLAPAVSFPRGARTRETMISLRKSLSPLDLCGARFRTPPHTPCARETSHPYRSDKLTDGGLPPRKPRKKPPPGSPGAGLRSNYPLTRRLPTPRHGRPAIGVLQCRDSRPKEAGPTVPRATRQLRNGQQPQPGCFAHIRLSLPYQAWWVVIRTRSKAAKLPGWRDTS
jgi:hypothetical protein